MTADLLSRSSVLTVLDAVDGFIGKLCRSVVLATGIALLLSITIGIIARYAISVGGADWAEELPKQIFAWFIMAGVVLALQRGNHIAVDLILQILSPRGRKLLVVGGNLLIAASYLYLCRSALAVADVAAIEINPVLGTPGSLPYFALTAGSVLTAIGAVSIAIRVMLLGADAAPQGKPEESVQ